MTDKSGKGFLDPGMLQRGFVVGAGGGREGSEPSEPVERSRSWAGRMPEGFRACGEGNTVRTGVRKSCPGDWCREGELAELLLSPGETKAAVTGPGREGHVWEEEKQRSSRIRWHLRGLQEEMGLGLFSSFLLRTAESRLWFSWRMGS